ncbi:MAG: TolC family protein [Ruminococcaceae bacterium]|nr:TolC family protein [Oscillospiraceae bacterium]
MKKFISVLLILFVSITTAFAQSASQSPVIYELTLDEAINLAYIDNPQLTANEMAQQSHKISIKSANLSKYKLKDMAVSMSSGVDMLLLKEGYYVNAAKTQLMLSELENKKIHSNIAYNVTESYYNLVLLQKLVNAAQNAYDLAVANQKTVDAQFELGLIARLDYENASVASKRALSALESYKLNYEIAHQNLKIHLNKDDENCIIKVDDNVDCSEFESDVNNDVLSAMNTRYDVTALKESMNLAKEHFDIASVLTEDSAAYNSSYSSYINADYNYTHNSKLIALSIKSAYNNIITSHSNMDTSAKLYEIKLKEYDSTNLKYQLGMITNLELTKAINELYEAQTNFANAKITYKLAVEKYKYEISTGL